MLPEFLFPVGNSMQDISRDDFSLLNGNPTAEKDSTCSTLLSATAGTQFSSVSTTAPLQLTPTPTTTILTSTTTTYSSTSVPNNLTTDIIRTNSALQPHLRTSNTNDHGNIYEPSTSIIGDIKLEEQNSSDLFPSHASTWQQHPMNSHEHAHHRHHHHPHQHNQYQHNQYRFMNVAGSCNKLLLQGSDDPLICRGANSVTDDDPPAEFNTLIAAAAKEQQQYQQQRVAPTTQAPPPRHQAKPQPQSRPTNGCSSLTKQQLKIKANLMSQSQQQSQHQATPAPTPPKTRAPKAKKKPAAVKLRFHHQALPAEYLSHYEATQTQTTKKEVFPVKLTPASTKLPPPKSAHENVRSWLQKIAEIQRNSQPQQQQQQLQPTHDANNNQAEAVCAMTEVLPPNDLNTGSTSLELKAKPAMATAHAKRVVKYSDLPYMGEITLDHSKPRRGRKPKKADICHLIYKNYGTILPGTPKNKLDKPLAAVEKADLKVGEQSVTANVTISRDEPLNLCLRDQSAEDSYSISSNDEDEADEPDDSLDCGISNCTTPLPIAADVATDSLLAANLKLAMTGVLLEEQPTTLATPKLEPSTTQSHSPKPLWPSVSEQTGSSSLMHPMSLYYQKLIESGTLVTPNGLSALGFPVETIQRDNQLALKIPIPSGLFLTPKQEKSSPAPCSGNQLEYPEPMSTPSSIKSENSVHTNTSSANQPLQPAPKRKRSAIFIPPMPAENANNPSNEVSICKFKFTGGARPTLQEKKMLSVDAGGNYRYYSGTGDKSMRGYEFFPRESLQHGGGVLPGGGEKLTLDIPPPSAGLSNELLQIPDSPTSNLLLMPTVATPGQDTNTQATSASLNSLTPSPNPVAVSSTSSSNGQSQKLAVDRKKKTRRSAQREKLEKTFKEKGFLIQTQQLESAEGATYCKFRQLKKFTRYLFRNWKDYLPDELQQANEAAAAAAAAAVLSEQQPTLAIDHATMGAVSGLNATSSLESILASHGFSGTQARLLRERHLDNSRITVESSLE